MREKSGSLKEGFRTRQQATFGNGERILLRATHEGEWTELAAQRAFQRSWTQTLAAIAWIDEERKKTLRRNDEEEQHGLPHDKKNLDRLYFREKVNEI